MTKKMAVSAFAVLMAIFLVFPVSLAAETPQLEISAEMKTGLIWDEARSPIIGLHHNDYAGASVGRFRLGMHFRLGGFGIITRLEQAEWDQVIIDLDGTRRPNPRDHITWDFAYAYGNLINDQLRISIGQLSNSPWRAGTGGDTIWQGLDHQLGIRTEIMPNAVPGLNFGFTLNNWNQMRYWPESRENLVGLLLETVFGVAYTNRHVHARFSWRLDSAADVYNHQQEGHSMMFRLEPRIITTLVPDLRVWLNGWWLGIGPREIQRGAGYVMPDGDPMDPRVPDDQRVYRNWLYIAYTPGPFVAGLRTGVVLTGVDSHHLHLEPSFHYWVLSSLRVGAAVYMRQNFGDAATVTGVPFRFLHIEPEVRFQAGPVQISLVYRYEMEHNAARDLLTNQWINLRFVVEF